MKAKEKTLVLYGANGKPIVIRRVRGKMRGQAKAFLSGFKGANDANPSDWVTLPTEINSVLRNDLQKLRARSRDLARNDDMARRFLSILKQKVLGNTGIILQAQNKLRDGKKTDDNWSGDIEREWSIFLKRRRVGGVAVSPCTCG